MAKKKPRTPPPPRRVQAPKQRHEPRQGMSSARKRNLYFGTGAAALIAGAVVLVAVLASGGNSNAGNPNAVAASLKAAGCTLATNAAAPYGQHIFDLKPTTTVKYSTYPPVSGRHYYQWAIWGNYNQPVDPRQAVHNEEHGGIDIWVGPDVSSSDRQKINDFYDSSPNAMLVTPIEDTAVGVVYPKHALPGSKIYLTTWTVQIKNGNVADGKNVIAVCPHFDEKAFTAFRDEFRGKGPERFPVSTLTPGT